MKRRLILASASSARQDMLRAAGLTFDVIPAAVDEPAVRAELARRNPGGAASEVAVALATAKARNISSEYREAVVIGSDQVLELKGEILGKPDGEHGVRQTLERLSGKAHALHSAVALGIGGRAVWTACDTARLTMRPLSTRFIDDYIARAGEAVQGGVGAYQIEGLGIQLFERVEGDHFTILGMPLLPLLAQLRSEGVVAA